MTRRLLIGQIAFDALHTHRIGRVCSISDKQVTCLAPSGKKFRVPKWRIVPGHPKQLHNVHRRMKHARSVVD